MPGCTGRPADPVDAVSTSPDRGGSTERLVLIEEDEREPGAVERGEPGGIFVEAGAFDADQARAILTAGAATGLGLRVHANQYGPGPGVQLACGLGAAAADNCTHLTDGDIDALASSGVVAGLLPRRRWPAQSPRPARTVASYRMPARWPRGSWS